MKLYHLFPDLMNLYGDYGNVAILKKALEDAGETVETVFVRPGDGVDFAQADFLYMGPGTEPARDAALEHLRPHAAALKEALLDRQVPALFTGNSWLALGRSLTTAGGRPVDGLGLFDYAAEESYDRYTGDAIALPASPLPGEAAVGFLNRCDTVRDINSPMFTLEMGRGNDGSAPGEGFVQGSFHATHLIGPLLVKNPHLLNYFVRLLGAAPLPAGESTHPALAYQVTLAALRERLANGR